MGDKGEDMQQMATGRTRTRVAAFKTEPIWNAIYPGSHRSAHIHNFLTVGIRIS